MTEQPKPTLCNTDLPALYRAANDASLRGQCWYVNLFRLNLAFLIVAAIGGAFVTATPNVVLSVGTAFFFVLSVIMGLVIQSQGYDRCWYEGRAIAESVKSMSWKYMMRSPPYGGEADALFAEDLSRLLKDARHIDTAAASANQAPQITSCMSNIRSLPWNERLIWYRRDRIQDQRRWYSTKADHNRKRRQWFPVLVFALQALAILFVLSRIAAPIFEFQAEAVIASIVAGVLAWMQLRRHHELSQSYAMASQELGLVEARCDSISSEEDFGQFVADAETAMSREHTMWLARRETA